MVIGIALTAAAGLVGGPRAMLAAGVGAILGGLNFWAIRRLASGAIARAVDEGSPGQALALVFALLVKMGALFALVWAAQRFLDLALLPFILGLCVFVFSCLAVGFWAGARDAGAEA